MTAGRDAACRIHPGSRDDPQLVLQPEFVHRAPMTSLVREAVRIRNSKARAGVPSSARSFAMKAGIFVVGQRGVMLALPQLRRIGEKVFQATFPAGRISPDR